MDYQWLMKFLLIGAHFFGKTLLNENQQPAHFHQDQV